MTPTETSSSIRRKKDRVIGRGGPGSESAHAMPTGREAYPDVCLVANQSIEGRPISRNINARNLNLRLKDSLTWSSGGPPSSRMRRR